MFHPMNYCRIFVREVLDMKMGCLVRRFSKADAWKINK